MIAHTTRRPRRRMPRARFQLAHAPLRRITQGPQRHTGLPAYPQVQMHPDDWAPIVQRAKHYAYVPLPVETPRWHRLAAHCLVLAVVALLLWGVR